MHEANKSRDSAVGIATAYGEDGLAVIFLSMSSRPALGSTQPPIRWRIFL
jgi:hypothetical protein